MWRIALIGGGLSSHSRYYGLAMAFVTLRKALANIVLELRIEDMIELGAQYVVRRVRFDDVGRAFAEPIGLDAVVKNVTLPAPRGASPAGLSPHRSCRRSRASTAATSAGSPPSPYNCTSDALNAPHGCGYAAPATTASSGEPVRQSWRVVHLMTPTTRRE